MLRLTKKADYGLMALKYLAELAEADGSGQLAHSTSASRQAGSDISSNGSTLIGTTAILRFR